MTLGVAFLTTIADLCINLSAGWFGAVFVIPITARRPRIVNQYLAIENSVLALAFLAAATILRAI